MKKFTSLVFILLCSVFTQVAAAKEYKCYVKLESAKPKIALIKVAKSETELVAKRLLLSQGTFAPDGVTRLTVTDVDECVLFDKSFSSWAARQLDQKTVF